MICKKKGVAIKKNFKKSEYKIFGIRNTAFVIFLQPCETNKTIMTV